MKIQVQEGNIISVEFTDKKITKANVIALENALSLAHKNHKHVNLIVLITQLKKVTFEAVVESIKFEWQNKHTIRKVAVVSNKEIFKIGTELENLFTFWKEKYFNIDDINQAWEWLKTNN